MDPDFIARLERQARAKQGLPPSSTDEDSNILPPLSPGSNQTDYFRSHPPGEHNASQAEEEEEGDDEDDDDDDDEVLRVIGEAPEEIDDQHRTHLEALEPIPGPSTSTKDLEDHPQEPEDEEDDGTTDSEEESRPKKPEAIPTIRLTLTLPTQFPFSTTEQSISLLAKNAGYNLPADTAITFGASALPEPELPPPNQDGSEMAPPPKRRRRKRIQERDEGYDKDDPFVDDSEAFIMEPKYYYPPARDGFFAATGRLQLKSDLAKSKTRKTAPKGSSKTAAGPSGAEATQTNPPKPKRRVPLTTVPDSAQPTQTKGPKTQNLAQQTQPKGSTADVQLASQPQNPVKSAQVPGPNTNAHQQSTSQSHHLVQQAQPQALNTDSKVTSQPSKLTQPTAIKGPNNGQQIPSQPQNTGPVSQAQANGCSTKHHQSSETQIPGHKAQPKSSTLNNQQNQVKEDLFKGSSVNHQANRVIPLTLNTALNPPAHNSNTDQKVSIKSSDTDLDWQISSLPPISSPKPISNPTLPNKTPAMPSNFNGAHVTLSHRSPKPSVATLHHSGTPLNPISLIDDEDQASPSSALPPPNHLNNNPPPIPSPSTSTQASQFARPPYLKSRSLPERSSAGPLPPPLEQALERLQGIIAAAPPFIPKKFPPELRAPTIRVAHLALDLNEYDECFFIRLAKLFPYNTFTIKKFVKREILPERKLYYEGQINDRINRLKQMIIEGMPNARQEYEHAMKDYQEALREYEKKQKARQNQEGASTALPANASTILGDTVTKGPFDVFNQNPSEVPDKPPKVPQKSFKLTPPMREILYELLKLEDELCETIKDTQKIVDKNVTLKDTSNRRQFYARLANLWPDDFMTTYKLSHAVGSMKKKLEGNLIIEPQNLITLA